MVGAGGGPIGPPDSDYDVDSLREALRGRTVGRRILHFDRIGSSMDETRRLAEAGEPEGLVCIVEEQTKGRGRFNRAWVSPRGQNVSFSLLLTPTLEQLPFMNMAAALSVSGALRAHAGLFTTLKWPNDVRVRGLKICGVLIENFPKSDGGGSGVMGDSGSEGTPIDAPWRPDGRVNAVIGIGVNVNMDPSEHPEIADLATSVYKETGSRADRTAILRDVLERMDGLYAEVKADARLTDRWAAEMETLGRTVTVRWQERVFSGVAESVDDGGNLILRQDDGEVITVSAGEVTSQT